MYPPAPRWHVISPDFNTYATWTERPNILNTRTCLQRNFKPSSRNSSVIPVMKHCMLALLLHHKHCGMICLVSLAFQVGRNCGRLAKMCVLKVVFQRCFCIDFLAIHKVHAVSLHRAMCVSLGKNGICGYTPRERNCKLQHEGKPLPESTEKVHIVLFEWWMRGCSETVRNG